MQRSHSNRNFSRRRFLVASGVGAAGFQFGRPIPANAAPVRSTGRGPAKSTILFFLCGGASHIDMWDLKPHAAAEFRGPFQPIETSAPGVRLSEHLPLLAQQAHHLALINSVAGTVNTNDHHAGYYHNLTGHVPDISFRTLGNNRTPFADDWPFMGSVVAAKKPAANLMPSAITLPYMPSRAPYTRPGQFAARLGVEHDPMYLQGNLDEPLSFQAPALELQAGVNAGRLMVRRELLAAFDETRRDFDSAAASQIWSKQQERALSMLVSGNTTKAFELNREPEHVRARYGDSVNAMSLLLARRLVEAGVPFVTVFWMESEKIRKKCGSGWDTHGNNFNCLKDELLPEFDRAFSALIADLAERSLLDETLLMVTSEMGRKPKIGDPRSGGVAGEGRDHWTHCLTDVLAGGGIRGGQTYGASDRNAEYPADKIVTPGDVTSTVYHAMGIEDLQAVNSEGRPYDLLADGKPILELF